MNVEIGAEAAQFPGKEYINGIAVAVCTDSTSPITNQPRKNHFHLYSMSPHLPQFQQSARATPLSGLSGRNKLRMPSTQ